MIRASWKYLLIGLVVVLALSMVTPQAQARWWGCGWGGCGWGGCGWGGCGWGGCGWGGCGYGRCGWRGWGCGGCGYGCGSCYSGCWSGCYGGSCGTCGSGCGYAAYDCGCTGYAAPAGTAPAMAPTPARKPELPIESAPAPGMPAMPAPGTEPAAPGMMPGMPANPTPPAPPITPGKTGATSADASGVLTVWVPYDAKVTVNGLVTKSTGSRRQFVSFGLKPGLSYKYVVKAEVIREGKTVEDTQTTVLTAGQVTAVAFGFNQTEQVAANK
jgi:uncharacterized protein (TIGR03000 family)